MAKEPAKTYLSIEMRLILDRLCQVTGDSVSQVLRDGILIYAKDIGLLNERVLKTMSVS